MKLNIDYSQVMNQVKAGTYSAAIRLIEEHTSKKGTRCVRITFQILGGDYNNRNLQGTFPLEGKAAGFIRDVVRAAIPDYADGPIECEEMLGKLVKLEVGESKRIEGERSYLKLLIHPLESELLKELSSEAGDEQ